MTLPSRTAAVDRRAFLGGALALPLARCPAPPPGKLTLAQVLDEAHALAGRHVTGDPAGDPAGDEAWVHAATALLAQLDELPPDPFSIMSPAEQAFLAEHTWAFRRVHSAPADRTRPAVITHQIHVAPNGTIPLHDHRDFFGAIVCADGEVEIRSFDVVDGGRDTETVTLRETTRTWMLPGRYSLLTRARDNVHEFRAGPKGARVLDLFLWLSEAARSHDLAWLDDPAGSPRDRCYRARWTG
jgi:hypothetical protein